MERALLSLERARQQLDHPEIKPDLHSILNDLIRELVDHGGLRKSGLSLQAHTHGSDQHSWLYALLEALTETCFTMVEDPNKASHKLRRQLDQGISDCRKRLAAG